MTGAWGDKMPERVWCTEATWWEARPAHPHAEYIRADLHEQEVRQLKEQLEQLRFAMPQALPSEPPAQVGIIRGICGCGKRTPRGGNTFEEVNALAEQDGWMINTSGSLTSFLCPRCLGIGKE